MDGAVILGIVWGFLAAAVQHGCLDRSVRRALSDDRTDPSTRIAWSLAGSMLRLVLLTAMFLVAWRWDRIRLDVSAVAFAAAHLLLMLRLGFKVKSLLEPPKA